MGPQLRMGLTMDCVGSWLRQRRHQRLHGYMASTWPQWFMQAAAQRTNDQPAQVEYCIVSRGAFISPPDNKVYSFKVPGGTPTRRRQQPQLQHLGHRPLLRRPDPRLRNAEFLNAPFLILLVSD